MAALVRVAGVIGAGVMGSAIAAHLAGVGVRVHLLDIVPPGPSKDGKPLGRNAFAQAGLDKALKAKPATFYTEDAARLIRVGNLEDDVARLSECDLVIEAVLEDLDVKRKLFTHIAPHLSKTCILASNTSGLSVAQMNEVLPHALKARFLVLHFFNPVRYMRLLEVVAGPDTDPSVVARMVEFGEWVGKGVVRGKDTTNFVANRIGVYSMMLCMHEMLRRKLPVEHVDAITGKPLGRPSSAAFGTADLVGIDTMIHVAKNCYDSLANDPERDVFVMPEFVHKMVAAGALGRKSGAGFYKKVGKDIQVIDLASGAYRNQTTPEYASLAAALKGKGPGGKIAALVAGDDEAGKFAWEVVARTLLYAARLVGEIADDIVNIDRAMRWGFNWDLGPFEVWDALGVRTTVERMGAESREVPSWVLAMLAQGQERFYAAEGTEPSFVDASTSRPVPLPRHPRHLSLARLRRDTRNIIKENAGAALIDLGDGVLCAEVHTKMNTIDGDVIALLSEAVDIAEQQFQAIVVANDADHFSAGANLGMIVGAALSKQWDQIDRIIAGLQNSLQKLKYSRVPVVSAPCQYTLGGGAELAMASAASQAYAETYMGLVEVGVGLVPAGGGCLRLVERFTSGVADISGVDLLPLIGEASLNIAMAKTSTSAAEARVLRYLRPTDGISFNRDFLLYEAKQRAVGLAQAGYRPPLPVPLRVAGYDAAQTIGMRIWGMVAGKFASEHDALIAKKIAHILCGGMVAEGTLVTEQHILDLEREAFLQLCGEKRTHERVEHMLKTGKPLRN
jgi:3-hydroxyacyl-CoA dehydrogenase